jgi:predicted transcriptional regulator
MTMQISMADTLAGVPIKQVRWFFRHVAGWHNKSFDIKSLHGKLTLDETSAQSLVRELVAQGYAEPAENDRFKLTEKGEKLVRSSAAGTIKRRTAEVALSGLLKRVEQYNSDPHKILAVETVAVFGSYLGNKEALGDWDVALKYRDCYTDHVAERALDYADRSGRTFGTFVDRLAWAEVELRQILKARKRTIAIQDWNTFLRVAAKGKEFFQYKVAFGDPDCVQAEIKHRIGEAAQARI